MENIKISKLDDKIKEVNFQIKKLKRLEKSSQIIKDQIKDVEIRIYDDDNLDENRIKFLNDQLERLKIKLDNIHEYSEERSKLESLLNSSEEERSNLEDQEKKILNDVISIIIQNKPKLSNFRKYYKRILSDNDKKQLSSDISKIEEIFSLKNHEQLREFIPYFLTFAKNEGNEIDINFLKSLSAVFDNYETRIVPRDVITFINSYLENKKYKNILDLSTKNGTFLAPIWKKNSNLKALGLLEEPEDIEILNILYEGLDITWKYNNLNKLKSESYDLVIGFPKWGYPSGDNIFFYPQVEEFENYIKNLINSLQILKNNGIAFLILPKWILSWSIKNTFISNLKKIGIYIDAILEIPGIDSVIELGLERTFGLIMPGQSDGFLIIFKRKKINEVFVAELSNKIDQEIVLDNLLKRKDGKIPQLGFNINLNDYYSIKSLNTKVETEKMGLKAGLKLIDPKKVFKKIVISNEPEKSEIHNIVYLSFERDKPIYATDSFNELKYPKRFNLKFFLNTTLVSPEYLKNLFNSDIGQKLLEYWIGDEFHLFEKSENISNNKNADLLFNDLNSYLERKIYNSRMYLPISDSQMDIIKLYDTLEELEFQISEYKMMLWKWPSKYNEIKKYVELLKVGNQFDYWIDSLPYPLSSILLACSADSNIEHKLRYVIHFFEALAEFNVTIMLSALNRDKSLLNKFIECFNDNTYPNWYYKPTFGNWNFFGTCIAKRVRKFKNEDKDQIFNAFGNPNPKFLKIITSKNLYNILREAAEYRNKWIGHGPPVDQEENRRRLKILESLLFKTNQTISHNYDDALLFQPIPHTMSYDGGIFSTKIKALKGRLPFKDSDIETIHPLNNNKLYLIHTNQYEAIELLPFFKIMESPKTEHNACYFYNRYEVKKPGEEINLISYHFDKESEVPAPYTEFKSIFKFFSSEK